MTSGVNLAARRNVDKSTTLPLETTAAQLQQPVPAPSSDLVMNLDATADDGDVSREALLMRAAELGPGPRLSLDNILMTPTDPILAQKGQPHVAKRRARLRTVVKVAIGLCAGFCIFATAATALSSSKAPPSSSQATASTHSDAPAEAVNPKEPLEVAATSKATPSPAPATAARGAPRSATGRSRKASLIR